MIKLVVIFLFVIKVKSEPLFDQASLAAYKGRSFDPRSHRNGQIRVHDKSTSIQDPCNTTEREYQSDFYIEIRRINNIYSKTNKGPQNCSKYCSIIFEDDETIELTCIQKGNDFIKWNDQNGFATGIVDSRAFKLTISPDIGDLKLNLTCEMNTHHNPRWITVSLIANTTLKLPKAQTVYLKPGQEWTSNERCYGLVLYPTASIFPDYKLDKKRFSKKTLEGSEEHQVIQSFNKMENNTKFYCIKYNDITNTDKRQTNVISYERVKTTFIFYLDPQYENKDTKELQEKTTVKTGAAIKADSQNNTAAILGGVLGIIIIGLLGVILAIWYKFTRQPDDGAAQVIYVEIEDQPMAPNPPPRNPINYTQVIGSLVPKEQPPEEPHSPLKCQTQTENLYCILE